MNGPPHLQVSGQPRDSSHPAGGLGLSVLLLVPSAILDHPPTVTQEKHSPQSSSTSFHSRVE